MKGKISIEFPDKAERHPGDRGGSARVAKFRQDLHRLTARFVPTRR